MWLPTDPAIVHGGNFPYVNRGCRVLFWGKLSPTKCVSQPMKGAISRLGNLRTSVVLVPPTGELQSSKTPRSHALRGNAMLRRSASKELLPLNLRHNGRRASEQPVPTQSVGTRTLQFSWFQRCET